jgi:hypothetical protein
MKNESRDIELIPGVKRQESYPADLFQADMMESTHTVYPHDEIFGSDCTVQTYIDCPPPEVFDYMANIHSLSEWTYSTRDYHAVGDNLYKGTDLLAENTDIYCSVKADRDAMTVDYHCAWDQGEDLWMIYLNRIVSAELVLDKPGSVVFWHNCRHPHYHKNPYPELSEAGRIWVGELWDFFYAGHKVELENLKRILEYRYSRNLPLGPYTGEEGKNP